jgi:flagella basal body P-ring formation protein FlgA
MMRKWMTQNRISSYKKFLPSGLFASLLLFISVSLQAETSSDGVSDDLRKSLIEELEMRFPMAEVKINKPFKWSDEQNIPEIIQRIQFLGNDGNGKAKFRIYQSSNDFSDLEVGFSAWQEVLVSLRRIHPLEKLTDDLFRKEKIDVALRQYHSYRGLFLPLEENLSQLKAGQTILEGNTPLLTGVRRIPDIRRGEQVRIRLISGSLLLSTSGIIQEEAHFGKQVRVLTNTTKKELVGTVLRDKTIEVRL